MRRSTKIILLTICLAIFLVAVLVVRELMRGEVVVNVGARRIIEVPIPKDGVKRGIEKKMDGGKVVTTMDGGSGGIASMPEEVKNEKAPIPEVARTWDCGEKGNPGAVKATLENGMLRIFGKGAMRDYENVYWAPWRGRFSEFFYPPKQIDSLLITDVVITEGVTHIGNGAFAALRRLKSVTISASVSSIGREAFEGCDSLMSIVVVAKNTRYSSENGVLFNKKGDTLMLYPPNRPQGAYAIPSYVTVIGGEYVFDGGRMRVNRVHSMGNGAFSRCRSLTSLTIPGNVKAIGERAFLNCVSLRSVTIENGVMAIGEQAFSGCVSLMSVTIPGSMASIENRMFQGCTNLVSVTIEEGVKTIGRYVFADWNCTNLMSVTIPSSVTHIGDSAFFKCPNLYHITSLNPIPSDISGKPFGGLPSDVCLYVPPKSIDVYRGAIGWNEFKCVKPIAEMPKTVVESLPAPAQTLPLGVRLYSWFWSWFAADSGVGYSIDSWSGRKYKTVKIGKQTWMAENLNSGYNYYDKDTSNGNTYGSLYDWTSAKHACPSGWHLPSRKEWRELSDATGDRKIAGKKLKSKVDWNDDDGKSGNGTDEFGFSAKPSGRRDKYIYGIGGGVGASRDTFYDAGSVGYWWSATGYDEDRAYGRYMNNYIDGIHEGYYDKNSGLSVRCVKDRKK